MGGRSALSVGRCAVLLHAVFACAVADHSDLDRRLCLRSRGGTESDCRNHPGLVGQESAVAIQAIIQNANSKPDSGILSTVLGVLILLIGAGGVVGQLQTSLNTIWGVTPKDQGVWGILHQRFISFALILAIGFLLLVSLVVSAFLTGLSQFVGNFFGATAFVAHALDLVVSLMFATALFAMIYKILPDVKIEWRDVWVGAGLTSILFSIGKILIGLYLGSSGITSPYGAAGSLITILLWVYYSSLIFFLGAEFTKSMRATTAPGSSPPNTRNRSTSRAKRRIENRRLPRSAVVRLLKTRHSVTARRIRSGKFFPRNFGAT